MRSRTCGVRNRKRVMHPSVRLFRLGRELGNHLHERELRSFGRDGSFRLQPEPPGVGERPTQFRNVYFWKSGGALPRDFSLPSTPIRTPA